MPVEQRLPPLDDEGGGGEVALHSAILPAGGREPRGVSVLAGGAVAVLCLDVEGLPEEELLRVEMHRLRPLKKRRRDENLHLVMRNDAVGRKVLALEVGIDRHLGAAASGQRRDEVQRHHPASLSRKFDRSGSH